MAAFMQCCSFDNNKAQTIRSKEIDRRLNKDRVTFRRTVRVLLLGAGESGKSTFLKQMRIIHGLDFDDDQIRDFRLVIYNNILKGMRVLIDARQKLGIHWGDETCIKDASKVFDFNGNIKLDQAVFCDYVDSLRKLWGDSGIRTAFERRREYQLGDSLKYFLDNVGRIGTIDPKHLHRFLRMSGETFDDLLHLVGPSLCKQNTNYKDSISAEERLAVTLRFLAQGGCYSFMFFLFRIPVVTLAYLIPETCSVIYHALTDKYLKNYVPSKQDILLARKATKGIIEHQIMIKGVPFMFIDVGGQRSQRQKWFQCFEGITSILFLASASEFDQVLMEDRKTNRLVESCNIFETIINNRSFAQVSIILFLNKMDLLAEKVRNVNIADYFPEFQGHPHSLEDVKKFLCNMFDSRRRERSKPLFHHFTTAIDTENIKHVFQDVKDTILHDNLRSLMLQ